MTDQSLLTKHRPVTNLPTGRIMYDNTRILAEAVLFEYRLKEARDTHAEKKASACR